MDEFRQIAPDVKVKRINGRSWFDPDSNTIYLTHGPIRVGVLADEMQHALDFARGFGKSNMEDVLFHALTKENCAIGTRTGLNLANEWWHRRVMGGAVQSINEGLPGFNQLQNGIDDVFHIFNG